MDENGIFYYCQKFLTAIKKKKTLLIYFPDTRVTNKSEKIQECQGSSGHDLKIFRHYFGYAQNVEWMEKKFFSTVENF